MPAETSVAVIGLGSRGLGVLERLISLADPARPLRVEAIDPDGTGAGVHALAQPDYLLLNTTCGQVSMFPDAWSVGDQVRGSGPSLYEWVTERGLRIAEDGFTVGTVGRAIRPTDFLPRRVLGEYLQWFLGLLLARLPEHVSVRAAPGARDRIVGSDGADGLVVTLSDGQRLPVRYAFLTTGYTGNRQPDGDRPGAERTITVPYPLPSQLERVGAGEVVAIGGFGLSAMDVMSSLTVGRGGAFVPDGDRLRYRASGREPELLFYSRSGLPCRARPKVVEFGPAYLPLVFTRAAVDEVRRQRQGPLDFRRRRLAADPDRGADRLPADPGPLCGAGGRGGIGRRVRRGGGCGRESPGSSRCWTPWTPGWVASIRPPRWTARPECRCTAAVPTSAGWRP